MKIFRTRGFPRRCFEHLLAFFRDTMPVPAQGKKGVANPKYHKRNNKRGNAIVFGSVGCKLTDLLHDQYKR